MELQKESPASPKYRRSSTAPLHVQGRALTFGTAFRALYHFKPRFTGTLALATAVYPEARIEVTHEGVILKPSHPPVAPKLIAVR